MSTVCLVLEKSGRRERVEGISGRFLGPMVVWYERKGE